MYNEFDKICCRSLISVLLNPPRVLFVEMSLNNSPLEQVSGVALLESYKHDDWLKLTGQNIML